MIVIPSPFTANIQELKDYLTKAEGVVETFQIDINDGTFLGTKTIIPEDLQGFKTKLFLDFHLMVNEPIDWIIRCTSAGANRVIGQVEHMTSQVEFVKKCQYFGVKKGLAFDIETDVSTLGKDILQQLDVILLMDYSAGEGGQPFNEQVLEKIKHFNDLRQNEHLPFKICCDGGIRVETIKKVVDAGADEVTVGKWLFEGEKYTSTIDTSSIKTKISMLLDSL
jgi:ribulose-phosphate 3-epimerase